MSDYKYSYEYKRPGLRNKTRRRGKHGGDKRWLGLVLLLVGSFLMLRRLDVFDFSWHDMWPWALIAVGIGIGLKSKFRNNASWILLVIGTVHLIPVFTIWGVSSTALAVPAALILLGIIIILNPSKKKNWSNRCENNMRTVTNGDSTLNIDVTFGGHKEVVTSKDFKGGRISTTFGGTEVNLMNADTKEGILTINLNVSFGGVELIVPSHWEIKNEVSTSMGSVEDNRAVYTAPGTVEKKVTLVLTGSCTIGSVEIKSY